jgi:hypothetical protein
MIEKHMNRPQPGNVIEVELHNRFAKAMIPPAPDTRVYRGQVLKSYKWLTDREFCMSGDDAWPIRVINLGNVVRLDFESGSAVAVDTSAQTWEVQGSRGDRYLVTRDSHGWSCDCKGFQFRKTCKHITDLGNK